MSNELGHPLFRLASEPPGPTRSEEVLRWLVDEDPIVAPLGVAPERATVEALHRSAVVEEGIETELAYLAKRGGGRDLETAGWICASWLARRSVPVWLELVGRIGPAHALISTKPVRGENRSLQLAALAVQKASLDVDTLLDELIGAPAWRGARKPVEAAIEIEAGYALSRTGALAAAELAHHAGRKAAALATLSVETCRKIITFVGHDIAGQVLTGSGDPPPGALSEIQHAMRWAMFTAAHRLELAKSAVLLHDARSRI